MSSITQMLHQITSIELLLFICLRSKRKTMSFRGFALLMAAVTVMAMSASADNDHRVDHDVMFRRTRIVKEPCLGAYCDPRDCVQTDKIECCGNSACHCVNNKCVEDKAGECSKPNPEAGWLSSTELLTLLVRPRVLLASWQQIDRH